MCGCCHRGELPNFQEGDYVHGVRHRFCECEKLCWRWPSLRRLCKALKDYAPQVEDLQNRRIGEPYGTGLKYYHDASQKERASLFHVLSSRNGEPVTLLMNMMEQDGALFMTVRWKGLSIDDETMEPTKCVYKHLLKLLLELFRQKCRPPDTSHKSRAKLGL